jgi:sugar lactone lactonase YvrE
MHRKLLFVGLLVLLLATPWARANAQEPTVSDANEQPFFLFTIGAQAPTGQFNNPTHIAVGVDGSVYISDTGNHRIQVFDATGHLVSAWGSRGDGDGQFNTPLGVAVTTDGTVFVVDSGNHRVQRFSAEGAFLGKWGSLGKGQGQFNSPGRGGGAGWHGVRGRPKELSRAAL